MTAPVHPEWSEMDSLSASVEGWDVFLSFNTNKQRPFWLERRSQLQVFASDEEAWQHVWRKAEEGSVFHTRALAFLKKHSPAEHAEIRAHGAGLVTRHDRFHPKEGVTHG